MLNKAMYACMMILSLALLSCGGGSTVTAVKLEAASTDVPQGGSTQITATADKSITENTLGEKVRFSFRVNESGGRLDVVDSRLDGNGQARIIYYAGTIPGNDVVQASFDSGATAAVTIKVGTGRPVGGIRVSQTGENTIRVIVTDSRGLPVVGAPVNLTISNGSLAATTGTTDESGVFQTTFTLPDGVNSAQVWATSEGMRDSTTVTRTDTDTGRIHLSQRANTVQATVTDRSGRPVADVPVNFSIRAGSITPVVSTNQNGVASATFELPAGVNSTTVVATSGGVTAQITVTRTPQQLAMIRLEQFGWRIMATALDASGAPLPSVIVNFRITTGTITPEVTTNQNGIAEATFTLPAGTNTAQVLASSGNVSATLNVVRPADPPASMAEPKSHDSGQADAIVAASIRIEQAGQQVRVQLKDDEGQGIPWALLQFTMNPGTVDPVSLYTNADGLAETTFSLPKSALHGEVVAEGGGASASLIVR